MWTDLVERTGGNPFFLEESVQTLLETQALVGEPGAYRLGRALPTFAVPATVQTVLAARIDRLPAESKHVLQTAAVIGQEVPLTWLQAVADLSVAGLRRSLAELQGAEFLYETRLFPDREYTFKHALTQQVAYETLLQERRRALHARLVETLEARAPERLAEQVDRLAYHAVRGEMWDKALVYSRQAGEHAMARSAYREAVGAFEQALRALTHRPETRDTREQAVDLRLLLRLALRPQGDFARILALLGEAEVHATALDDPRRLGQVSMWLSNYFSLVGAYDRAVAAAQRALTLADASGDVVLHALANRYLGAAYQDQGDYRRAIDCLGETMVSLEGARRYQRYNQPYLPAVIACAHLAECHAELGRFAEGRAFGEEGLRIAEAMAHPTSLMYVIGEMGKLFLHQGDLPKALPLLERAVHLCHEADLSAHVPWNISPLGVALALSGRVDAAMSLLRQAMEQASGMDVVVLQARCRLALGQAQVLAGCLEEAQTLSEQALALARDHQQRGVQAYALCLLGEIAGRRDPVDAALAVTSYRQALVIAEDLGMRPLQAHCHRGLGTLCLGMERRAEARTELAAAMARYRAMDMTLWLPEVDSSLVAVEGR
jgi:tetratricopeptide (TPR) repeat protein